MKRSSVLLWALGDTENRFSGKRKLNGASQV
jgi:hypothetical protein